MWQQRRKVPETWGGLASQPGSFCNSGHLASRLKHTGDSLAQGFPLDGTTQGACLGGSLAALRRCRGVTLGS